jgi:hypothetical protein
MSRDVDLAPHLDRALLGSLPCITCGYDLKGISIRSVCPECGTAVRAAILYQVDPEAEEFQPIFTPHVTAIGIVVWCTAGLVAMLALWWLRLGEVMRAGLGWTFPMLWAPYAAIILGALSGVSVLTFLRPSRGSKWWHVVAALVGGLAYVPLLWGLWQIQILDAVAPSPYLKYGMALPQRALWRLVMDASIVIVFLGLRPNLRELVRRSLAMRTGRVDRQTLLAMVGAVGVAAIGDCLRLLSWQVSQESSELLQGIGSLLVMMGSLFLTLGMVTAVIDGWRISKVILMPPVTLKQVLEGPEEPAGG